MHPPGKKSMAQKGNIWKRSVRILPSYADCVVLIVKMFIDMLSYLRWKMIFH